MSLRRFAIWFLLLQAGLASLWWCALLWRPDVRVWFMAKGAPDTTLLAFAAADGLLFIGAAAAAAYGFSTGRHWAWPILCVHAGAAGYAALYALMLVVLTGGDGWLGAALMSPSLVVPGLLVWGLRPKGAGSCSTISPDAKLAPRRDAGTS